MTESKFNHLLKIYEEVKVDNIFESLTSGLKISNVFSVARSKAGQIVHTSGSNRSLWDKGSEFIDDEDVKDTSLSDLVSNTLMDLLNRYINYLQNQDPVDDLKMKTLIVYLSCRGLNDLLFDFNFNDHYSSVKDDFIKKIIDYKDKAFEDWITYLRKRGLKKHLKISIDEGFNVFSKKSDRVIGSLFPQREVSPEVLTTDDYEFLKLCRSNWIKVVQSPEDKLHAEDFMGLSYTTYKRRKNIMIDELLTEFSTDSDIIYLNTLILD